MTTLEQKIHRYATSVAGPPAHDTADQGISDPEAPEGRRVVLALALACFVLVGGIAALALRQGSDASAPSTATQPSSGIDFEAANERLRQEQEAGFVSYLYDDPVTGVSTLGYVPVGSDLTSPYWDPVQQRLPVFDGQSDTSELVGYDYAWIGFVQRSIADSGSFDAKAKRIELYGCDPLDDNQETAESCSQTAVTAPRSPS